jgi:putative oxidoreductase
MFKKFFRVTVLPPYVDFAIFILRVGIAFLMIPHGYQKFQKIINGEFGFADPIGIGEAPSLILAAFAELICSILVLLGLFTRPALFFLISTMTVVAFIVKMGQGLGEMEKALLYLIPFISLYIWGPGRYSFDYYIFGKNRKSVRGSS